MTLILKSAMARTQRDFKVTICNFVWMANHLHLLLIAHDAELCRRFMMELQKKITDSLKRLVGFDELHLWEGSPSLAKIEDLDKAIEEIIYYFCNPARADLVEDIRHYPGFSTWNAFIRSNKAGVEAEERENVPWLRLPKLPFLPGGVISESQDRRLTAKLTDEAAESHELIVKPNAWMQCFGITSEVEVAGINERIVARIGEIQSECAQQRSSLRKHVIGARRLQRAAITWTHKPKEKSRKIYVLSTSRELRMRFIENLKSLTARCRDLFRRAVKGEYNLQWPPGVFLPPLPPRASAVSFETVMLSS